MIKFNLKSEYWLTRFVFLRLLSFVYFFAFLSLATQVIPLIGEKGLTPTKNYLSYVSSDSAFNSFINLPTLFWFNSSDKILLFFAWSGVILSIIILIGYANVPLMFFIWFLYMSFVHIGQIWYSFGWEIQLLETGFIAIFLVPFLDPRPFPKMQVPLPVIWLLRWLTFRIHLGAGLIKIRGDSCWRDFTCLFYHYETQPIPNPLSPYFHFLPKFIHKLGVLWNHFIELVVPFFVFYPRNLRIIAGILLVSLQFILILSGNLSFLNWITIVAIIGCFDDRFFRRVLPKFIIKKAEYAASNSRPNKVYEIMAWIFFIVVILLSVPVIQNLIGPYQIMNTSFNRLHLVNTYGAFGSVGNVRYELVISGTSDKEMNDKTKWKEYEFMGKPGNVSRGLPVIAPYQPRIDWEIWFAAMSTPNMHPWVIHLVWKLLHNDKDTLSLLDSNQFNDKPPEYIKVDLYKYEFLPIKEKDVWNRTYLGSWLPPLSKSNEELRRFIRVNNWD